MKKLIYIFSIIILFGCNDSVSEEIVDDEQSVIIENYKPDYSFSKQSFEEEGQLNKEPVTIEAYFMQYACGDENDDMKVNLVQDTTYNFLLEKDIDPLIFNGQSIINGWFYTNKTEKYHMNFRLSGYISECAKSGCYKTAPKFWITHIEKIDGSKFIRKWDGE